MCLRDWYRRSDGVGRYMALEMGGVLGGFDVAHLHDAQVEAIRTVVESKLALLQ